MINCVVAVEQGQGIGFKGIMPWPRLVGDMKWFKKLTTGHVVVMGSTTWNSLPGPLSDRINVVISSKSHVGATKCCPSPAQAITECKIEYPNKDIFIIGGQILYDSMMPEIDKFYVTEIDASYQCDKHFNLAFVKEHFKSIAEHAKYTTLESPVSYTIKEYSK